MCVPDEEDGPLVGEVPGWEGAKVEETTETGGCADDAGASEEGAAGEGADVTGADVVGTAEDGLWGTEHRTCVGQSQIPNSEFQYRPLGHFWFCQTLWTQIWYPEQSVGSGRIPWPFKQPSSAFFPPS